MLAPVVALDFSHEGKDERDQVYGAVPPEAVQVAEYDAPAVKLPLCGTQLTVRVVRLTINVVEAVCRAGVVLSVTVTPTV
jgi:hypothetical protein